MAYCQSPGCQKHRTGYSRYCNAHKARAGRHGHPLQETITAHRLKQYVQLVRGWVARQRQDNIWQLLEGVWAADMDHARGILAEYRAGRPSFGYEVQAANDLVKVAQDVPARRIVETVVAMSVMLDWEARAFKTDQAFWCQVARRFRGLSDLHVGSYWDNTQQRVKRVYRDPKPQTGIALGRMLVRSLGSVGPRIIASEHAERQRAVDAKYALVKALESEAQKAA